MTAPTHDDVLAAEATAAATLAAITGVPPAHRCADCGRPEGGHYRWCVQVGDPDEISSRFLADLDDLRPRGGFFG